jgi:3-hydroxyacyl-CoA dehydrogenase
MALHGTALGGGLELAMAGHFRVAVAGALVGQPEVNLGIIPGGEGTQRLPRLVGIAKALEMCVGGRAIKAPEALDAGLIDALVEDDLTAGAVAFARRAVESGVAARKTRERQERLGSGFENEKLFAEARQTARRTRPHQIAPLKAVEAIEAAAALPFDRGCERERELFVACVQSEQAKALIHVFFAERAVSKVPGVAKDTVVTPVSLVGIVGAGTMGTGIAMACANAGLSVILRDATQQALDAGVAAIRKNYEISVSRGRFTAADVETRLARIRPQLGLDGFEAADLIVEAVFEDMALKERVFQDVDVVAKPECVLATNTSTLDVDRIATATWRAQAVLGMHFFSPANVMRLVEIVRGRTTSPEALATALAVAKRLGKVGVVVGNCPGFVGNRMMFPYMYETQYLVEEGATPDQVDRALTAFGMAMGMFAVDDMAGIDVAVRARRALGHFEHGRGRKPLVQDLLFEMGRLGQKTGKGWYRYDEPRKAVPDPEVVALIRETAESAGIPQRQAGDEEIVDRAIYALVNEGARVLDEGFALRASDIDVIYTSGYGFPAWRGGPMFYADRVGLPAVVERIRGFEREFGERWTPAPLLVRLAASGRTFRDRDRSEGD